MVDNPPNRPAPEVPPVRARSSFGDFLFRLLCQSAALSVILLVLGLVLMLIWQGWPVLSHLSEYKVFTTSAWDPDGDPPVLGAWVFIYGTVASSAIAMLVAVPLGVGAAAFLAEIAPAWLRRIGSFLLELLAAIPSVVYGFWGLKFLAPGVQAVFSWLGGPNTASGQGILSAGLILAIMILPYITAISFDVCRAVPRSQREGALALGATRWQTIRSVILPYARPGIIAACFLALGRALGETMAVTMLIGNVRYLDFRIFATGDSIASLIANQLREAGSLYRSGLITLALILFLITAVTNILARVLIARLSKPRIRRSRPVRLLTAAEMPPGALAPSPAALRRAARRNRVMTFVLGACQFLTVLPLFLILGYIAVKGAGAVDWNFFTELPKPRGELGGGLKHAIVGSLVMVALASLMAVPVGIFAAVFLAEYRTHRLNHPVRFITELLAGVPSIVIGIYIYTVLVAPPWSTRPLGYSAWAGAVALAIMMLPVVIRGSEEAMKLVPGSLREASYALGASRWQTVARVIIPASLPAIITGILLAVSRIAGETAPLLLTARGSQLMPESLGSPTPFLPYYVWDYSKSGDDELTRLAWAAAFVLLFFVVILNAGIRLAAGKRVVLAAQAG
jgi:phosphate transport system permease protein